MVLQTGISQGTGLIGTVGGAVAGAGNAIGPIPVSLNANATAQIVADLTK